MCQMEVLCTKSSDDNQKFFPAEDQPCQDQLQPPDVGLSDDHLHSSQGGVQYDEKMLSLTYLSSAEVHRPAGHQGDGDHHRHEGRKRQPPHPLQHLHHEEVDNNDGGKTFYQNVTMLILNSFCTNQLQFYKRRPKNPCHFLT